MEFRVDFFFRVVMDVIFYLTHLAFFTVLYRHTSELGGWNLDQVYVFVAGYFVVDAFHMTLFSNNCWWLPIFINKGDLDYYLVRPVSPLFFLSLRDFAANSFLNLLIAIGILVWALARYPGELGALHVSIFLLLLGAGVLLHYILYMLFIIQVFWTHSSDGVHDLFFGMSALSDRPHRIYRGWTRTVLTSVLPFALVSSFPTYVLFERSPWQLVAHVLVVVGAAFAVMVFLWRWGLRSYASASS